MSRLVVADAGPIRYLSEIGLADLLGRLFDGVLMPNRGLPRAYFGKHSGDGAAMGGGATIMADDTSTDEPAKSSIARPRRNRGNQPCTRG